MKAARRSIAFVSGVLLYCFGAAAAINPGQQWCGQVGAGQLLIIINAAQLTRDRRQGQAQRLWGYSQVLGTPAKIVGPRRLPGAGP